MMAAGAGLASAITHLAIHTAIPDATGSNQSAAARQPVTWTNTGGDLTTGSKSFTGGAASTLAAVMAAAKALIRALPSTDA